MLYREIIAVCSEIHTNHINCVDRTWNFLMLHLVTGKVTTGRSMAGTFKTNGVMFSERRRELGLLCFYVASYIKILTAFGVCFVVGDNS